MMLSDRERNDVTSVCPSRSGGAVALLFRRLASARASVLFLDYDGTLAPFHPQRDQAFPYEGIRDLLGEIQAVAQARVVIVTGRPSHEVARLLALEPMPEIWGAHGWEHRAAGSEKTEFFPMTAQWQAAMTEAMAWAQARGLGHAVESKQGSVALHWRWLAPEQIPDLHEQAMRAWQPLAHRSGIELKPFDGGMELRAPGRTKGDAVRIVLDSYETPPPSAYLGDDLTDEDAFAAINDSGLSILVRQEWRKSAAQAWLHPPGELIEFLKQWRKYARSESSAQ